MTTMSMSRPITILSVLTLGILFGLVASVPVASSPLIILGAVLAGAAAVALSLNLQAATIAYLAANIFSPKLPMSIPIRPSDILMAIMMVAWLRELLMRRTAMPAGSAIVKTLWIWVALGAVSTLVGIATGHVDLSLGAEVIGVSQQYVGNGLFHLLKRIQTALVFVCIVTSVTTGRSANRYLRAVVYAGVALAGYLVVQYATSGGGYYRTGGPSGDEPNTIGLVMVLLLALVLGQVVIGETRSRLGAWAQTAILLCGLIVTFSRTSYVAFVVVLLVLLGLTRRWLLPLVPVVIAAGYQFSPDFLQTRIQTITAVWNSSVANDDWSMRVMATKYWVPYVLTNAPVFGYGLGNLPPGWFDNEFTVQLNYTGLAGVVCLVVLLSLLVREGWKRYARPDGAEQKRAGLALCLAVLVMVIGSMAGAPFTAARTSELFWALAAILLGLSKANPLKT